MRAGGRFWAENLDSTAPRGNLSVKSPFHGEDCWLRRFSKGPKMRQHPCRAAAGALNMPWNRPNLDAIGGPNFLHAKSTRGSLNAIKRSNTKPDQLIAFCI